MIYEIYIINSSILHEYDENQDQYFCLVCHYSFYDFFQKHLQTNNYFNQHNLNNYLDLCIYLGIF